mgnify:CR=1 FL=1
MTAIACSMSCTAQAPAPEKAAAGDKPAAAPAGASIAGMTEKQSNSYMIGMDVAKSLEAIKDEIDVTSMTQAMQAVFNGKPTKLTPAQAEQIRRAAWRNSGAQARAPARPCTGSTIKAATVRSTAASS